MKKILVTLATLVMSATIALAGAPTAQANDDGLCWNGWLWTACVQGPGWVDWNPGATGATGITNTGTPATATGSETDPARCGAVEGERADDGTRPEA